MRAQEFLTEYQKPKIHRDHRDGLDLEVRSNDKNLSIYAYDRGGRELAHVHFDRNGNNLVPYDLEVGEDYRGLGIAAVMYDYAKELGYRVERSGEQTDAGRAFWDKNRGEEKVWEDDVDEGWKSALAGAAATGAMAFGGAGAADAKPAPAPGPSIQAQAKMSPIDKLKTAAKANGIHGTELAQFLAQCAHESANFKNMEEIGSPAYFAKKYDPKHAPKTARILGNTQVGDGERYKGRGFIQLTGRDNYKRAGAALNLPLEANPDLAARPDVAAVVAVWYWKNRVANKVKNFSNTKQATKAINPAMKGIADRQEKFKQYQVAMR